MFQLEGVIVHLVGTGGHELLVLDFIGWMVIKGVGGVPS